MADLRTLIARYREIEKAATPGPWYGTDEGSVITGDGDRVCAHDCIASDPLAVDADMRAIAAARNLFAALLDVVEAADWACDGSGCEFEDERLRYETWQHHVGAMRALREKLAKAGEAMEANRG